MGQLKIIPVVSTLIEDQEPDRDTISAVVSVNKTVGLFFNSLREYQYKIEGSLLDSYFYSQALFTLENWVAKEVDQYDAPHYIALSSQGNPQDSIVVTGSTSALCRFLEKVALERTSTVNTLLINDNIRSYSDEPWFNYGLKHLPDIFSKIQPPYFAHLTRLQILVVPEVREILSGFGDLLKQGCLNQLKSIELPFSAKSQPRLHHSGNFLIDNPCSELIGFYSGTNHAVNNMGQLEHFHFAIQTKFSIMYVSWILRFIYDRLKTLVIDSSTPNAGFKEVFDRSVDMTTTVTYGDEIEMRNHSIEIDAYVIDIPHYIDIDLEFLDKIVQANAANNQLESLEIYHWIPGYDFPFFDCARLAQYITSGYLPRLNTISLRQPIGHIFGYGLDTSALLEAALSIDKQIQTLRLLIPEKNGYIQWLLQLSKGAFKDLTYLSYHLPDRLESEKDIVYESRVDYALRLLDVIAREHPKLRVCVIEGSADMLSKFREAIEMIDTHIAGRIAAEEEWRSLAAIEIDDE